MFTTIAALVASAMLSDPLAPAWDGLVQCYGPDVERKTCMAIARYRRSSDGSILNDSEVLLSPSDPEIIIASTAPVFILDNMVCGSGVIKAGDVTSIRLDGATVTPKDDAQGLIPQIIATVNSFSGAREICTRYDERPEGGLAPALFYDGKPGPVADLIVLWVRPEDGWRVAP